MAPHLLKLPAEIRNLIYEYALTEEDGILYYHEDCDWVGRLFLEEEEPYAVLQFKRYEDRIRQTKNEYLYQQYLRARSKLARLIPNQLQFVCHQLHYETRGLSIKYNTVVFDVIDVKVETAKQCFRFLDRTEPQQRDFIRARIIYDGDDAYRMLPFFRQLSSFCQAHPKSQITLYFQYIDEPCRYIRFAHILRIRFGKEFPFLPHRSISTVKHCYLCQAYNHSRADVQSIVLPSNLCIFPSMTEFDEDSFRLDIKGQFPSIHQISGIRSSVDIDSFVAWAKDLWENGV